MKPEFSNNKAILKAVLGPTNTGKTHYALERMLSYNTGMMGFPLRLLARENYDRAVEKLGVAHVALVTGEEKIVPPYARYFFCTVESMPVSEPVECMVIDEIQLCTDPERGHIFTDRILHARGTEETIFIGSDAMRPLIKRLMPEAEFIERPRLSTLTYTGFKKLTRLPPRTAIVAFSVDDVYAIAELIRRQRGGTAIVLGALSPRTRNAQVAMYQAGEVDYLVATDAIGMGLNLDIHHVAFARTQKFDGKTIRPLKALEMAQIAGRAGRYMRDGTFGLTGSVTGLDEDMIDAIQNHTFEPIDHMIWRNTALNFDSLKLLAQSLDEKPPEDYMLRGRPATDYMTLKKLMGDADIIQNVKTRDLIHLLWDCCQIPDFRQIMNDNHALFVKQVFMHLRSALNDGQGRLPMDWVLESMERLNRTDGDMDSLMNRIAHIRTWTYISHRSHWLVDAATIQSKASAIEDTLSDALHERLAARFVSRESSLILKKLGARGDFEATINDHGEVFAGTYAIGHVKGFSFEPYAVSYEEDKTLLMKAARPALSRHFERKIDTIIAAGHAALSLSPTHQILWQDEPLAGLSPGTDVLKPSVTVLSREHLSREQAERLTRYLQEWLDSVLREKFSFLHAFARWDQPGPVSGILFNLYENQGSIARYKIADLIELLSKEDRQTLRRLGVILGAYSLYHKQVLTQTHRQLASQLWAVFHGYEPPMTLKDGGIGWFLLKGKGVASYARLIGYYPFKTLAVRLDLLERLNTDLYDAAQKGVVTLTGDMISKVGIDFENGHNLLLEMGLKVLSKDERTYRLKVLKKKASASDNKKEPVKDAVNHDSPFAVLQNLTFAKKE